MNGELAQLVYLAGHGSSWLASDEPGAPPADFGQESWAFQFVGSLRFRLLAAAGHGRALDAAAASEVSTAYEASTVSEWLLQLRERGAARLWLTVPEVRAVTVGETETGEHHVAWFANAGRWSLLAAGRQRPEVWRADWTVGDRSAADRRIWSVSYEGARVDRAMPQCPDIQSAATQLSWALVETRDFAARQGLAQWSELFEQILSADGEGADRAQLLPPRYSAAARHLLAEADHAWVFGGMESWNDLKFTDSTTEHEFRQVSRDLYIAVLNAVLASTNCDFVHDAYR